MKTPDVHATAFVHPSACVAGEVSLAEGASVWPGAVLRGDMNRIEIGKFSNIQDLTVCHVDDDAPCLVGDYVVCGHQVTLHGCTVGNESLIGIGATVLSHAVIEPNVIVGARSLVSEGKKLESGYVYYGSPAKRIRPITDAERKSIKEHCMRYAAMAGQHKKGEYASA